MAQGLPGAPLKNPTKKIGWPERALVTSQVRNTITELCTELGMFNRSNIIRLGLFLVLERYHLMTPELYDDETWKELQEAGIV